MRLLGGVFPCDSVNYLGFQFFFLFFLSFNPFTILVVELRMYIAINLKRYKKAKEVGKITMNVRIIAYYQLMQVCQAEYFRQLLKPVT